MGLVFYFVYLLTLNVRPSIMDGSQNELLPDFIFVFDGATLRPACLALHSTRV